MDRENVNHPFVLLLSPYKAGSCYLSKIMSINSVPHARLHAYDAVEQACYPIESITHVITCERKVHLDLYISAYFADIHQKHHYPYGYADTKEAVDAASIEQLVQHFFTQPWRTYRWLNYNYYRGWMRAFARRGIPTLTLITEQLSTPECAKKIEDFIRGSSSSNWKSDPIPSHVTSEHPSGKRYLQLKSAIKKEHKVRKSAWAAATDAAGAAPL